MSRLPFVNNNINNSLTTAYLPVIPPPGSVCEWGWERIVGLFTTSPSADLTVKETESSFTPLSKKVKEKYKIQYLWSVNLLRLSRRIYLYLCNSVLLPHQLKNVDGKGCGVFVKWSEPTWNGSDLAWSFASDLQGKRGEHHEQDRGHFYEWCNLTDQLLGRL